MKYNFLTIIILFTLLSLNAQINLEHNYSNGNINYVNLAVSGEKYYLAEKSTNRLMIYNLDHSVFKSINLPYSSADLQEAYCVSENLFTLDGKICFFVAYMVQSPFSYTGKIINEDGTVLKTINDSNWAYAIQTENDGAKFIARKYTQSYEQLSAVYSLPGTVVFIDNENSFIDKKINLHQSYPNPSNGIISIPYELPSGELNGKIMIYNIKGEIVKTLRVDRNFSDIILNTYSFPSGVYSYYLKTSNSISKSMKFIVTK